MADYGENQMREFFERAQVLVIGGGAAGMMEENSLSLFLFFFPIFCHKVMGPDAMIFIF